MLKRIILPIDTINILKHYGDIDTVIDKILNLAEQDLLPTFDLPPCGDTSAQVRKISVHITNQWYIDLIATNAVVFSLRRLLQYFVDNELFNAFNWQIVHKTRKPVIAELHLAQTHLINASKIMLMSSDKDYCYTLKPIINTLSQLCEELS